MHISRLWHPSAAAWAARELHAMLCLMPRECRALISSHDAQMLSGNYTAALARLYYDVASAALGTRNCTPGCGPWTRLCRALRRPGGVPAACRASRPPAAGLHAGPPPSRMRLGRRSGPCLAAEPAQPVRDVMQGPCGR